MRQPIGPELLLPLLGVTAVAALSLVGTFVATAVAVGLPLWIERRKRPAFLFSVADPTVLGGVKYLHVKIINRPLEGRWLLRNTATGCVASVSFEELGSGKRPVQHAPARWSARSEPWTMLLGANGSPVRVFDDTKLEQCFRMDLSPSEHGEVVIAAIKHEGDPSAYALSKSSYEDAATDGLRSPKLKLPGDEYKLTVRVEAGGLRDGADFRVRNRDGTLDEFSIEPWED